MKIRIGTRASKLALWQTNFVAGELQKKYPNLTVETIHVTTKGDKILDSPLSKIGGKGLFTKEIEQQMLEGKIDCAVHSMKDVPVQLEPNFKIAAITKRTEPFDAFVSNKYVSFKDLPANAKVGTSSLRRRAQILAIRSDLQIVDLRGNVDTRLKKLDDGNFDAIILASAGLKRLGYENRIREILTPNIMLPAVGQGALAIETLSDNDKIIDLLQFLDDTTTRTAITAERTFMTFMGGSCQIPIGIFSQIEKDTIKIEALIASLDGKRILKDYIIDKTINATSCSKTLAEKMINNGGYDILKELISEVKL